MPAEKEKPGSTEKTTLPPAVDTTSEPPDKTAGPQPVARAAESLSGATQAGAPERARMVGSMQQSVGNARVGRMLADGVRRKAEVSSPEDKEEKEADNTAEKVMRMSEGDTAATSSTAPAAAGPSGAGGQPLSKSDRDFMEPRFGRSFENVRLHTDREANEQATGIGAKAFTQGSDISFGPGHGPEDKKLLAHELTHVTQQGTGNGSAQRTMRAPGPLTAAQEASAVNFTRNQYDERSIRIIQLITGTTVDGKFGDVSAQAVATWQGTRGLGVDGKVGTNTLNQMVIDRATAGFPEHAIQLCIDFHNLNVRSDTLSVQFVPEDPLDFLRNLLTGAPSASVTFGPGNLRVIKVGPRAFFSEPTLFAAINAQLTAPAPPVPALTPRPTLLTPAQERAAISFNQSRFSDRRSVLAIQGHVAANPDGKFGPDTVERIANHQLITGLTVDGKVGLGTLEVFVTELIGLDFQDAAIRLIVDFFNFNEANLLDVYYDPNEPDYAGTDARPNEPVRVDVGPRGLAQPFPNIVHTIAHEFEHVRQHRIGIADPNTREFLGEAIEILSVGMPEEDLESLAPGTAGYVPGFAEDATRALIRWNAMSGPDRSAFRLRFIAVRDRVRARIAAGTAAQQALHATLLANYNAVVVPP